MQNLHELTKKEMTRGEFLATIGFSMMTLFGLGALTRLLGKENAMQQRTARYGSGTYGGPQQHHS